MAVINSNLLAISSRQHQNRSQSGLSTAMERLSSGLRVNGAKDDAAGQAIGNRMTSQINGQHQAMRNANEGISLSQTAQGALDEANDRLQRIRELTMQGLNDTLSLADHDAVQAEINLNLKEIDRLAKQSNYNGIPLLDGTAGRVKLQVGANVGETLDVDLAPPGFSVDELGLTDFTVYGIEGEVSPLNTLTGSAKDIYLDEAEVSYNVMGTAPTLMKNANGDYFVRSQRDDGSTLYSRAYVSSRHTTASDTSIVNVYGSELYTPANTLHSSTPTSSNVTFKDDVGNPLSGASLVEAGNGNYYIEQTDVNGDSLYRQAEVAFDAGGSTLTATATDATLLNGDAIGTVTPVNAPISVAVPTDETGVTFKASDGSLIDASQARLMQDASGHYAIETIDSSGNERYYAAEVSVGGITSSGQPASIAIQAQDADYVSFDALTPVDKVSGYSTITLDTRNVTVNYTDAEGQYHPDVMKEDDEGKYYFDLSGGENAESAYKTATLVNNGGRTLIKTVNGSGDVIIYYPASFSRRDTDANGFNDDGTSHTIVNIQEIDQEIRLKTPHDPLAALDRAIARVDSKRSTLGATENRLGSAIDNLATTSINLTAARSRIMDADYAVEVSNMTKAQILQQASTSMLAQANQVPQSVLSLLN